MNNLLQQQNETARTQALELTEIETQPAAGESLLGTKLDILHGVKVMLNVNVGEIESDLGELMGLKESTVLKINKPVDYVVDVTLNGKVVARGQLVVVDDNFGVKVTEVFTATKS
ncbi:FliM/FliN family flagellar motor switch protein [Undibacterium sp. TJN25]|uniref:FliM/FliN family flagellar motor switch protein n=1 Tax=Undibacterium sp. TJN25 TaxID=3413056 RepID=UPI003BEFEAB1